MAKKSKQQYAGDGAVVAQNRKARHEYEIVEKVEAGIALNGNEVKSVRLGKVSLAEAYARVENGEVWIHDMHIQPYEQGDTFGVPDTKRPRKLLLHRREIDRLAGKTANPGTTLVPLRCYFKRGRAKIELAVGRGKKAYDKRRTIQERDLKRDMDRVRKEHGF